MKICFYITLITVLFISCAQQSSLSGGDKDFKAPELNTEKTFPKNGSINFKSNKITLSFDEYINLTSPNQNVVITPSLDSKPLFEVKGKSINVLFQEKLDTNTTYTINFGNAISDITEGNKLLNFNYVFSTGSFLDSLTLAGNVYDAFYKTPKESVLVGLYKEKNDSVGFYNSPYYFTKSKPDGSFIFNNIKVGQYKLLAIKDENNNLKYNQFSEEVSFLDSLVVVNSDTVKNEYNLSLFKEEEKENWIKNKKYKYPGKVTILLNKKSERVEIELLNNTYLDSLSKRIFNKTDSITFWLNNIDSIDALKLAFRLDEEDFDSLKIKLREPKKQDTLLRFKTNIVKGLPYFEPLSLIFKTPLEKVDVEKIKLINEDSIFIPFDYELKENKLNILADFKEEVDYEIFFYPGSLNGKYNRKNDSIHLFLSLIAPNNYGSIVLNYERKNKDNQEIIQLLKDGLLIEEFVIKERKETLKYNNLLPGAYQLKVIDDINNNGKWDTGDYLLKKQPELVKLFEDKINLKAGWDLDLTWKN